MSPTTATPPCDLTLETSTDGDAWDAFVRSTEDGSHTQTTAWARVKGVQGWGAERLVVRRSGTIVAGVQVLTREVGRLGRIAFAPRGPLVASGDSRVTEFLHTALLQFGREERIRYLKVQPPAEREDLSRAFRAHGWAPSSLEAAPTATVVVDLAPSDDELLRAMRKSTRQSIRKSMRSGLHIRAAGEEGLDALWRMLSATAKRQGFTPYPRHYYETMLREFGRTDRSCVLVGELDGELTCASLLIGFRDTVSDKIGGWSGEHGELRPNEAAAFAAMLWGKEQGLRWYDLEGIYTPIARTIKQTGEVPEAARRGVTHFKLGFGGKVELLPDALDTSPNAVLRPVVRLAAKRGDRLRHTARRVLGRDRQAA
jgi:peptidoglycan pentaglycine glycine transferase (the first glycine)